MEVGKCLECNATYNSTSRRPKLLDCGHIICLQDLERMVKAGNVRCPTDKKVSKKAIEEFVDDHSQMDLIDSYEVRCTTHKIVAERFCLRDCVPVCESCINEHRSCDMRALPDDQREISMRVTQEIDTLNKQFGGQISPTTKGKFSRIHNLLLRDKMDVLYKFRVCQSENQPKCASHQSPATQFCATHMVLLCAQCPDSCAKKRFPGDLTEISGLVARETEALMATIQQQVSPDLRARFERRQTLPLQDGLALVHALRKMQPRDAIKCCMCPAEADGFLRLTDFKAFCAEHGQKQLQDESSSLPLKNADDSTICQRIIDAFPRFLQKVDCYNLSPDQIMLIRNPPHSPKALQDLGIALIRKMSSEKGGLEQAPDEFHCPVCMKTLRRATAVLTVLPCRFAFHAMCDSCVREKAQEPRAICPLDKAEYGVPLSQIPPTSQARAQAPRQLQPKEPIICSLCPAIADGALRLTDFKAFCAEHSKKQLLDQSSSLPLKGTDDSTICQRIIETFPRFLQKVDFYNLSAEELALARNPPQSPKALQNLAITLIRKACPTPGSLDLAPENFQCPECMRTLRRTTAVLVVLPCKSAFHAVCDSCAREKAQELRTVCPLDNAAFGMALSKLPSISLGSSPPAPSQPFPQILPPGVPLPAGASMVPPELQATGFAGMAMPVQSFGPGGLPPQGFGPGGLSASGFPQQPPAFQSFQGQSPSQAPQIPGFQTMPQPQGFPPQGFAQPGFPPQGFSPQGFPPQGFSPQGFSPQGFPPQGFSPQGYPQQGFPPQGFPPQGFAPQGFSQQGFPPQGYPPQGYPQQGFPQQGYPQQGFPQQPPKPGIPQASPAAQQPAQKPGLPTQPPAAKPAQPAQPVTQPVGRVPAPQPPIASKPGPSAPSVTAPQKPQIPATALPDPSASIPKIAGTSLPPLRLQPPDYVLDRFPSVLPPVNVPAAQRVSNQRGWSQTSGRNQVEAVIFTCSENVKMLGVSIAAPVDQGQTSIVEFINLYRGKDTKQRPVYSHTNRERIEGGNMILADIRFAQPVPIAAYSPFALKIKLMGAPDVGYETYRGNPFDRPEFWFGEDGSLWEFEECTTVENGEYLNGQNNLSGPILRFLYRR